MNRILLWAGMAVAAFFVVGLWVSILTPDTTPVATDPSTTTEERDAPDPTAQPTQRPTPEPTPDTSDGDAYFDFLNHQLAFSDILMAGLDDVAAYSNIYTTDLLVAATGGLRSDLRDELRWLDRHRPAPCYKDQYRFWKEAMVAYERSMDLISDGAIYIEPATIERGTRAMNRGTDLIDKATLAIDRTDCGAVSI